MAIPTATTKRETSFRSVVASSCEVQLITQLGALFKLNLRQTLHVFPVIRKPLSLQQTHSSGLEPQTLLPQFPLFRYVTLPKGFPWPIQL